MFCLHIQRSPTLPSSTARRQRFALYQQCRIKALLAMACRRKWGLIVLMQQVEECDIEAAGEYCANRPISRLKQAVRAKCVA